MAGPKALDDFFQRFRQIKANLEEAEAHKGPLTNAREILRDLRTMFVVAGGRAVDYRIVVDGNTRLAAELKEAKAKVDALEPALQGYQDTLNARDAEIASFTGTVTNLHSEIAALRKRLRELGA